MERKTKEELKQIIHTPIQVDVLYGNMKKPDDLIELERFAKANDLDLYALGFFLDTWMPFSPQPVDMIPFATTGEDGTYFAFLTDFKAEIDLSQAPVVVYSSGGLEFQGHTYSPVLFARNFRDFLTICCRFPNPEAVYEDDPRKSDFDMEFLEMMCDEDELEEHKEVARKIQKHFGLREFANPNHYFKSFYEERNGASCIQTNDPINIDFPRIGKADSKQLTEPVSREELDSHLRESDLYNRLKMYRDYPNLYTCYSSQEFLDMMEVIIKHLKKDGFEREAHVLQLDFEKSRASHLLNKIS